MINQLVQTRQRLLTTGLVAVAVAVVGAAGIGLAGRGGGEDSAAAATGSTSAASASPAVSPGAGRHGNGHRSDGLRGRGPWGGGLHGGGMVGGGMVGGGMGSALHGTFVVPDPDGSGYRTLTTQRGTASKISATSITVRSDDGFEQTYAVASSTQVLARTSGVTSIKSGAQVVVLAETQGGSQTARSVADLTTLRFRMGGHGDGPGRHGLDDDADLDHDHADDAGANGNNGDNGDGSTPAPSSSTAGTAFHA